LPECLSMNIVDTPEIISALFSDYHVAVYNLRISLRFLNSTSISGEQLHPERNRIVYMT